MKKKPLGFGIGCGFGEGRADGGGGFRIAGRDWGVRATTSKHFTFHRDLRKFIFVHLFGKFFFFLSQGFLAVHMLDEIFLQMSQLEDLRWICHSLFFVRHFF